MSIVFIPKIAEKFEPSYNFGSGRLAPKVKVVPREQLLWPDSDLHILIELRALRVSFVECGKVLKRSANSCTMAVATNNLYEAINKKRNKLIKEVIT
tara:strand:- start:83 stop:373 length:291 start_codon:yes stop_codon:yes gene_type:complete